jgi:hypothetical protein
VKNFELALVSVGTFHRGAYANLTAYLLVLYFKFSFLISLYDVLSETKFDLTAR